MKWREERALGEPGVVDAAVSRKSRASSACGSSRAGSPRRSCSTSTRAPCRSTRRSTHSNNVSFLACAEEVARVDKNGDGVISAEEGDLEDGSDGFPNNERLYVLRRSGSASRSRVRSTTVISDRGLPRANEHGC